MRTAPHHLAGVDVFVDGVNAAHRAKYDPSPVMKAYGTHHTVL
jgi:hypothetical protein